MLERTIEQHLVKRIKELGGLCIKLTGYKGAPDRLCLLPFGTLVFVELKRQGGRVRPEQERWLERLKELGFKTRVVSSKAEVDELFWSLFFWRLFQNDSN